MAQPPPTLGQWRIKIAELRQLAENDFSRADVEAQILQSELPGDATPADKVRLLNLLARIALNLGRTEQGAEHIRQAFELAQRYDDKIGMIEADLNKALNAVNQARIEDMNEAVIHSMTLLEGIDRPELLAEAMLRSSMMYRRKEQLSDSVALAVQALDIAKRSGNAVAMAYAYQGMAAAYDINHRHAEALEYYRNMHTQAIVAGSRRLEGEAMLGMGGSLNGAGDFAGGEAMKRQGIEMFRGMHAPFYVAHGLLGLAEILREQNRFAEALAPLDEAVAIYEQGNNKIGLWWALNFRGNNYLSLGKTAQAHADAERGYQVAKSIGFPLYSGKSAKSLADIAAASGDYTRAYRLLLEANEMAAKVEADRASTRMVDLAEHYQNEIKQRQIDELNRRNEKQTAEITQRTLQQRWLWTVLGGSLLLMMVIALFLARQRRANRRLQMLNRQVEQARNKLQATLDAIPDLMFEVGLDGRYYECHTPQADLLTAPAEQLIGRTVLDVMPAQAAAVCLEALKEAHQKGCSFGRQLLLPLPNGDHWFELSIAAKPVEIGEKPRFIVMSRDITERKRAEREIVLLNLAVNTSSEGAFLIDATGRFVYVNDAACRSLGYSRDELLALTPLDIDADLEPAAFLARLQSLFRLGPTPGSIEACHRARDGRVFPVELSFSIIEHDGASFCLTQARDISERKLAEAALKESEQRYRLVFENSPVSIWEEDFSAIKTVFDPLRQAGVTDIDAYFEQYPDVIRRCAELVEIVDVNQAAVALHAAESKEALFASLIDTFTEESFEAFRKELVCLWNGETAMVCDAVVKTLAGDSRHVTVYFSVCPGYEASFSRVLVSLTDITERKQAEQQLALLGAAIDRVREAAYFVDEQGRFFYVNEESSRALGYSREELLNMTVMDIAPGWTMEMVVNAWQGLNEDEAITIEAEHRRKDGGILPVEINITHMNHGGRAFALAMARDITERKQAERLLHEREQAIRAVVENSPDFIARYDARLRRIYVNPTLQKLMGRPLEQILGTLPSDSSPLQEDFLPMIEAVFEKGVEHQVEMPFRKADGEMGWDDIRIVPEFGPDGRVATVLAIGRDITERKRAEEALAARERELSTLAQSLPDNIARYDRQGRTVYINPVLEKTLGVSAANKLSRTIRECHPDGDYEDYAQVVDSVLASGEAAEIEKVIPGPEGQIVVHQMRVVPEYGENGDVIGVLAIGRDITESKRMENDLRIREQYQRALLDNFPFMVWLKDTESRLLAVNRCYLDTAGLSADANYFGKTDLDLFPAELAEQYWADDREVMLSGQRKTVEEFVGTPGALRWHETSKAPVFDSEGKLLGTVGYARDITERKLAEIALRESEEKYRFLIQKIQAGIVVHGSDTRILISNAVAQDILGLSEDQLHGKTAIDTDWHFFSEDGSPMSKDQYPVNRVLTSGLPLRNYVAGVHRPGRDDAWVLVNADPVFDPAGEILQVIVSFIDITQRKHAENALQDSELRYREIFENVSDSLYLLEVAPDGRFRNLAFNFAFEQATGLSREDLIGRWVGETNVNEETARTVIGKYQRCVTAGMPIEEESVLDLPSGRRTFYSTLIPLRDESGRICRILGVARDMTEIKRAERKFRTLAENAPDNICRYDRQCRILYLNPPLEVTLGLKANEVLGKTPVELYADGRFADYQAKIAHVAATGMADEIELEIPDGGDGVSYCHVRFVAERDAGEIVGVLAIGRDITEHKRVAAQIQALNLSLEQRVLERTEALRQQSRYLRTIIDALPLLVWLKDTECRFVMVNQATASSCRMTVQEMVGKNDLDLWPDERAGGYIDEDREVMTTRRRKNIEEHFASGGRTVWIEIDKVPVLNDDGSVLGLVGVARDISERKTLEAARERALAEAVRLARLRSEFMARMSHELRTPLNGILGYAQVLLREKQLDDRQSTMLGIIQQSGEHLLNLINDILDFAKIEAGKQRLSLGDVRLPRFLRTLASIVSVKAEQKGLSFHCDIAADVPEVVRIDETRLRQVLLNLLSNAVKYSERGRIDLRVRLLAPPGRLCFEIQDSGIGIPPEQQERIFQPFEQSPDNRFGGDGSGLGLAISRELVRLMGSDIRVSSRPGEGSTFWFELDVATGGTVDGELAEETLITGYQGPRQRVLVVDDNASGRRLLVDMFSHLGFDTTEIVDGEACLVSAEALPPDLIMVDMTLPDMDGLELTRRLRRLPVLAQTPIIIVSADTPDDDVVEILRAGSGAFLAKPIDMNKLTAILTELLKLDWVYTVGEAVPLPDIAVARQSSVTPPLADMLVLHDFARQGSMRDIIRHAGELAERDPLYRPFAEQLRALAQSYQSKAVLELVQRYLDTNRT